MILESLSKASHRFFLYLQWCCFSAEELIDSYKGRQCRFQSDLIWSMSSHWLIQKKKRKKSNAGTNSWVLSLWDLNLFTFSNQFPSKNYSFYSTNGPQAETCIVSVSVGSLLMSHHSVCVFGVTTQSGMQQTVRYCGADRCVCNE